MDSTGILFLFKFFKLHIGYCNLRDFIKTIEKIGVALPKIHDIQQVFDYYDENKIGKIEYKKLSQEIYNGNTKKIRADQANENVQDNQSNLNQNLVNILKGKK